MENNRNSTVKSPLESTRESTPISESTPASTIGGALSEVSSIHEVEVPVWAAKCRL